MPSLFEIPLDESVQVLKRVLPLMSQQRVPTIPQNYAIWYDYVTNKNDELSAELEGKISAQDEFDSETCRTLYEKFYLAELHAEVDGIQGAVRNAVESVLSELGGLGEEITHFSEVLDECGESLEDDPTPEDLNNLVVELVRETARTKARSQEVEGSLHTMASELTELRSQVDRLSRDSRTDALTGIANRRAFDEAIRRMTKEVGETGAPLCLILADIDHFKKFNDTHGHLVGDKVLRFVAQEIEQCVKGRDMLARYGGEEFAVLLPNTPIDGAMMLGESIRAIIEAQRVKNDQREDLEKTTISLGVAQFVAGESIESFIERADACLYASKHNGRNCVTSEEELAKH
ncbi:MAG: diguanylate cyclase [Pseudomonadales bacterium]|nr:diguanylate cyclase [Pseudomonadales bacterium]